MKDSQEDKFYIRISNSDPDPLSVTVWGPACE